MELKKKVFFTIDAKHKETLKRWYSLLILGRMLDERAPNYLKQAIGWSYHAPCAGHDGIQLAIGQAFTKGEDHLFPYYRDMMTAVSAGLTAEEIILNGISKATDLASGGRHMSNHFARPDWNIHNVSSCTGNHTLHAVGAARAMKTYKHHGVSISSQGESSVSEGYCYEAINGADREQLPVIFVIQDNGYGISVPKWEQTFNEKVADNFRGFTNLGIIYCDGKDPIDSANAMLTAREEALKGRPIMVHADCVRIGSHSNSDSHDLYRDDAEIAKAKSQDPLPVFRKQLLESSLLSEDELKEIEAEAKATLMDAHKKAIKAPDPDPKSIFDFVIPEPHWPTKYADGNPSGNEPGEELTLIQALNTTLKSEFRHNPDTYLWGQDVANKDKGGIFNVSKGMQQEFGRPRVFNGPIAEDFILGTANGFSRFNDKIRVVVEGAEFADYFWPAMEQYVDSSHDYWRSNGKFTPNMIIRLASGGYIGGGLYHSQNIEGSLASIPGVRIVYPSFADDAAGLLRTAMRSKGMTMFMEPKALYNAKMAKTFVPDDFEVPFGKARVRKEGSDLTVITYGNTTHFCLEVASQLEKEGKSLEVIDLRTLVPLDEETILKSIAKTNRVMIVHEDKVFGGFGGEVAAVIGERAIHELDAPIGRVGSTFTPVGFNRILEKAILPDSRRILDKAKEVLSY